MTKIRQDALLTSLACLLVFACADEGPTPTRFLIEDELEPFVTAFYTEAEERGIFFDRSNLIVQYGVGGNEESICGSCNSNDLQSDLQKIVTVFEENRCWYNSYQLEALIFHELAHCLLGRIHLSDTLPNGAFKSIMAPNAIDQYSPCFIQVPKTRCNLIFRRDYYVDELFEPDTPVPEWAID